MTQIWRIFTDLKLNLNLIYPTQWWMGLLAISVTIYPFSANKVNKRLL